jgi:hypothetical protein
MTETRNLPAVAAPVGDWLRTADQAAEAEGGPKPCRYRRDENWDPASASPARAPRRRAPGRLEEFIRLREAEGLRIGEAAERLGVAHQTGSKYERARKARLAESETAGGAR